MARTLRNHSRVRDLAARDFPLADIAHLTGYSLAEVRRILTPAIERQRHGGQLGHRRKCQQQRQRRRYAERQLQLLAAKLTRDVLRIAKAS